MTRYAWLPCAAAVPLLAACPSDTVGIDTDSDSAATSAGDDLVPTTGVTLDDGGPGPTTDPDPSTTTNTTTPSDDTSADDDPTTGAPPTCGNNILEGDEVCDLTQLSGETCQSQGFEGGVLGCLLDCSDYNTFNCFICGNGKVENAEECEMVPDPNLDCEDLGFPQGGILQCGKDCMHDTSECQICGDGIQQGFEDCDGLDLGGDTCASLGFDDGTLDCNNATCAFDYSGCSGGMFTETFEGSASLPAVFTVNAIDPWFVDETMPVNGTRSARSGALLAGGITSMSLDAQFPVAGTVSFVHETSCGSGFDFLEFYVDGAFVTSWTGITAAAAFNQPVAAGAHTFEWRFNRSAFINKGADAVWVDDITLSGGVPL